MQLGLRTERLSGTVEASDEPISRATSGFQITVRGELTQQFVDMLGPVVVDSTGDESILSFERADQAKLQSVLTWLYERGIEIVSIAPDGVSKNRGGR